MYHSVHIGAAQVKKTVQVVLAGRFATVVHKRALGGEDHHVFRVCAEIIHAGGTDGHQVLRPVKHAQVAEGALCQAGGDQAPAVLHHQLPLFLQQHCKTSFPFV